MRSQSLSLATPLPLSRTAAGQSDEGEYMVSCVIRGQPQRVAAALMRLRSNTTILGPAAHVEVLQHESTQPLLSGPGTGIGAGGALWGGEGGFGKRVRGWL
jgi:hypothetical protein